MDENEAIELLGKLKSFIENTNMQITTLINKTHNLEVEISKLKRELLREKKLILPN